jgi:hypothetical protein
MFIFNLIIRTQRIFLSDVPVTNKFCLSSSGLKTTQYGTFLFENLPFTAPVSTSHSLIIRSNEADKNSVPSLLNEMSRTPCA